MKGAERGTRAAKEAHVMEGFISYNLSYFFLLLPAAFELLTAVNSLRS
jgi:hypothetical protein